MFCIVSPFSKTFDEIGIIYYVPEFLKNILKIGQIVEIPIKQKIEIGVVLKILNNNENKNFGFDESKIKSIISIKNENIFLKNYQLELVHWVAKYYFSSIHNAVSLFFPKNLRQKITKNKINLQDSKEKNYSFENNINLTKNQEKIFNEITQNNNENILLFGITGSGKTEIYIKLIKKCIDENKQVLLLIPEIVLTNQISEKIINVFGNDVIVINSTVSDAKKTNYWIDIYNKNAKIIIGTRSALFYPYNNLGLIIIDEEHDNSYISETQPRYNSIEIAEKITKLNKNKLILASGTPSIKSMYKGINGEYKVINLFEKFNG